MCRPRRGWPYFALKIEAIITIATTTTAGGGAYLFANLAPGHYIVGVAAAGMYGAGQPLFGLTRVDVLLDDGRRGGRIRRRRRELPGERLGGAHRQTASHDLVDGPKQRVRVLEQIVTDAGAQTATQIEALRGRDRITNGEPK